ncbi:hypothetical protein BGY98DRAFT_1100823 [Russula aff. rugulosa BPL654]|nr:hypothetical protein BGY98DRAFT_1100823 [Russula aff. rugulosa BPL654]
MKSVHLPDDPEKKKYFKHGADKKNEGIFSLEVIAGVITGVPNGMQKGILGRASPVFGGLSSPAPSLFDYSTYDFQLSPNLLLLRHLHVRTSPPECGPEGVERTDGPSAAFNEKMRRYNVVSGILFIIFIINFALAAPVLVQEKSRACVGVVQVTEDVITALGKRGEEGLEKLAEGYLKTSVDSSGAHASAESAESAPDGRTSVVQAQQAPNSASSTANTDHALVGPPSPSPAVPQVHEVEEGSEHAGSDGLHGPPPSPASTVDRLELRLGLLDEGGESTIAETSVVENFGPKASTDSDFAWTKVVNSPSPRPASSTGSRFNWKKQFKKLVNLKGKPQPGSASSQPSNQKPSTGSGINWKKLIKLKNPPPPGHGSQPSKQEPSMSMGITWKNNFKNLESLKDAPAALSPDQASSSQPWNPKLSTMSGLLGITNNSVEYGTAKEPGVEPVEVIHEPPSSPDSEPHSDHQSSSPQQDNPEAALYRAKGKAKVIEEPKGGDNSDSD